MRFALLLFATILPAQNLSVDSPNPTQDKPQSKLWFAHNRWFAWLPTATGSSIWQRPDTPAGQWTRTQTLNLNGHADVLPVNDNRVCAALAHKDQLTAACLGYKASTWQLEPNPATWNIPGMETATIAAGKSGALWIAYNHDRHMWVRHNESGQWSGPIQVSPKKAAEDDICAITSLHDGSIGVLWSDQNHDAVYFRIHKNGQWLEPETLDSGNKTADDHISIARAPNGSLHVAMKNSSDAIGQPQLTLRIRSKSGKWTNQPYAPRTAEAEPSRPIILLSPDGKRTYLLHSLYQKKSRSTIALHNGPVLIDKGKAHVNNVTGPKSLPAAAKTWIVLASDPDGNVYESLLPR